MISGYTDITALSCDIGVIRISGFQKSYPISQFQNSDIGTYTDDLDTTVPDIIPDVSLPLPVPGLAFQLILRVQYQ